MEVTIVFPHQLYQNSEALSKSRKVLLVEDSLYFLQYPFHKQKIALHRASMKYYEAWLSGQGFMINYVEAHQSDLSKLFYALQQQGVKRIHYTETIDYLLERRLKRFANMTGISLQSYPSPNFWNTAHLNNSFMKGEKRYFMANYYIKQRKHWNILLEADGSPTGGKWSFDTENRKRVPKGHHTPNIYKPKQNDFVREALAYANQHFSNNPGSVETFDYPITHDEAARCLADFLTHRLHDFGAYEDAILQQESILYHSWLTPALNIGLLSPEQIISETLKVAKREKVPLNSVEGFVRQVIGWREFMRMMYEREGVFLRTNNFFGFTRSIPTSFYSATTGIEPVDQTIKKILQTGYCHHIERLMVLGNFMLLCEFDPDEVYKWFMELFIDSYDWVMVPNVYGMSQYADGGLMTTKPYISGSSYILKMSDYGKGSWCEVWDGLYWRFIHKHEKMLVKNPRMSMMVNLLGKMDQKKLSNHLATADQFLKSLSH